MVEFRVRVFSLCVDSEGESIHVHGGPLVSVEISRENPSYSGIPRVNPLLSLMGSRARICSCLP